MRNLCKLFLALALAGGCAEAGFAQTVITAATGSISIGATPISAGVAVFIPVDSSGHGIAVTMAGGGFSLPVGSQPSAQPIGYTCTIVSGGIPSSCPVPDAGTSAPSGFAYNVTILDTSSGNPTSGQSATLVQVHNITGSTWQLDHYSAIASVSFTGVYTSTQGVGAPTGVPSGISFYTDITTPTAPILYEGVNGAWETLGGSGGAVTATAIATALGSRGGCNVAGQPYVPQSNSCVSVSSSNSQRLVAQLPASGLVAAYTHEDCTNPYKDYSGNGNDGVAVGGVVAPTCAPNGLSYYGGGVLNAWALPTAVSSTGLTYVFSILPLITNATNGAFNQGILQSTDAAGGTLNLFGSGQAVGNYADAWSPQMGTNAAYSTTTTWDLIPAASVLGFEIGSGVSSDYDKIYINGRLSPFTTANTTATTLSGFSKGTLQIGGSAVNGGYPFFGTEVVTLVYSRKLTDAEQVQVWSALRSYTQTRTGQVDVHPTGNSVVQSLASSNIVCVGDSITYGVGVPNSWCTPALFTNPTGERQVYISNTTATPGIFAAAISTRIPQLMIQFYEPQAPKNTGYIFAGTNDMSASSSASDAWHTIATALVNSHYGNAKVVYMPMVSRTGADSGKDALNALSDSLCPQSADYCVAATDPLLYADNAYTNATYFQPDGIHPTTAGQTLLAKYAMNAYMQLYGSTYASPTPVTSDYTVTASDNYILATANSVITLYNCLGYSKSVDIRVNPGITVSVKSATSAQTINNVDQSTTALSLTAGKELRFQVMRGAAATGGCTWAAF